MPKLTDPYCRKTSFLKTYPNSIDVFDFTLKLKKYEKFICLWLFILYFLKTATKNDDMN